MTATPTIDALHKFTLDDFLDPADDDYYRHNGDVVLVFAERPMTPYLPDPMWRIRSCYDRWEGTAYAKELEIVEEEEGEEQ